MTKRLSTITTSVVVVMAELILRSKFSFQYSIYNNNNNNNTLAKTGRLISFTVKDFI